MTDPLSLCACAAEQVPLELLLEADPDEQAVARYQLDCQAYVAQQAGRVVAACLLRPQADGRWELMNIATLPDTQGQGVGSELLRFAIAQARDAGAKVLFLGTGTFGYQLAFYQRQGFRVTALERDHFLDHYPEPIFEQGIQHKDRLILSLSL
ncbi:GNAT family N-acetyltransferase [Ferrimonas marina]|uniref:Acetyltransferase (GNAT) family protein n=1 Tax=Ferrimonas marina TaxID=299255 RepID=A0A1M5YGM6_9GAMM|nr:GNAT family N-acetyltransferase [Ferrimonas marina]SHI11221.1 Acetyltransferase (GNAT) family protein [Ferrimonas marina]